MLSYTEAAVNSYRELIVWRKSIHLVKEIYKLTALLPKNERFAISDQMIGKMINSLISKLSTMHQ